MRRAALVLLLVLTGCTETVRLDTSPLAELAAITITPPDAALVLTSLGEPHSTLQYTAVGQFADGSSRDITTEVAWAIDRDELGGFEATGLFVASHAAAGHATVAARASNLQATTSVLVTIDATVIDTSYPPPAANLFAPPRPTVVDDPTKSPSLVYPSDGVVFPTVIASTVFQFARGTGNDAVRLRFDSSVLHLSIETGSDRWRADGTLQRLIASAAGPEPLLLTVEATSSTTVDAPIFTRAPAALEFSQDLGATPLYYWSAATSAVERGGADVTSASRLYPGAGTCAGCHAIDHEGDALALAIDRTGTGTSFELGTIALPSTEVGIAASASRPGGWSAFSPDGTRLVVASNGVLTEYDPSSGASLGTIPLPAGKYATHPDWSPDGSSLAVALSGQAPSSYDVRAASIAVLSRQAASWTTPSIIVTGGATSNNYFPRWSPDGSSIAYVHATTASRGAASAELMLVRASGGSAPVALARANHRVGSTDLPDLANTMPAWAPRIGPRSWLAFTSTRPYGNVAASAPPQIWITSIDLASAGDPSTPAFWLPCQDITVRNMTPAWSSESLTL